MKFVINKFQIVNVLAKVQGLTGRKSNHSITEKDTVCILVGRVGKEKSISMAVEAFAEVRKKHPTLKLMIVGGGPQVEEIKHLFQTLGADQNIIMAGYIPQEKIPLAYYSSDLFMTASTTETQGLTSIEAMATGLPLVLRQDAVQHEVAGSNENALFFNDHHGLVTQVDALLTKPKLREKLIKNASKRSHDFSLSAFGKKVEGYYKDIVRDYKKTHNLK
jgi:1,2-diacylglycerol 3-alpha-glucosyltransferase